jgi:hypothetical protein
MTQKMIVVKRGYDVLNETNPKNFIFDSDLNHLKTSSSGSFQRTVTSGNSTTVSVLHGLPYKPMAIAYFRSITNNNWFITMTQVEPTNSRTGINCNVELYTDLTKIYFKINNYDGSNSFTIEVKYEIFYEGI